MTRRFGSNFLVETKAEANDLYGAEPEPITDEERRRDAESEALILQITKEDPGYWDRLADRIIAEAGAEGGSVDGRTSWIPPMKRPVAS